MQAILFMGIQGSGKTTFYKERFVNTHLRISLDVLRTRHREKKIFECCLATGTRIVIDNTNPGTVDRHRYIGPAKQAGYEIVGYHFAADLPRSIERNESRGGREVVPRKGVMATYKKLEPPSYGEGFDRLFSVAVDPRGGFQVEEWHE